jgi:hypothetical protein
MEPVDAGIRMNLFLDKARHKVEIHGPAIDQYQYDLPSHAEPTNLIRLSLHLKYMRLELLIVLYPSLLFEESTAFIGEFVESFVQGNFVTLLA